MSEEIYKKPEDSQALLKNVRQMTWDIKELEKGFREHRSVLLFKNEDFPKIEMKYGQLLNDIGLSLSVDEQETINGEKEVSVKIDIENLDLFEKNYLGKLNQNNLLTKDVSILQKIGEVQMDTLEDSVFEYSKNDPEFLKTKNNIEFLREEYKMLDPSDKYILPRQEQTLFNTFRKFDTWKDPLEKEYFHEYIKLKYWQILDDGKYQEDNPRNWTAYNEKTFGERWSKVLDFVEIIKEKQAEPKILLEICSRILTTISRSQKSLKGSGGKEEILENVKDIIEKIIEEIDENE